MIGNALPACSRLASCSFGSARPGSLIKDVSWGVLPLVAGLFILVEALEKSGLIRAITSVLKEERRNH
jgi:arsenical pump membrane protein